MKTAWLIKQGLRLGAKAALYELEPPLRGCAYVVVDTYALADGSGELTKIYKASVTAEVKSWRPLATEYGTDHGAALASLGYEVSA